jgi:hypothetical protein
VVTEPLRHRDDRYRVPLALSAPPQQGSNAGPQPRCPTSAERLDDRNCAVDAHHVACSFIEGLPQERPDRGSVE